MLAQYQTAIVKITCFAMLGNYFYSSCTFKWEYLVCLLWSQWDGTKCSTEAVHHLIAWCLANLWQWSSSCSHWLSHSTGWWRDDGVSWGFQPEQIKCKNSALCHNARIVHIPWNQGSKCCTISINLNSNLEIAQGDCKIRHVQAASLCPLLL